ncbi:hypothetical protein MKW98_000234 [Papaver atlanticum]|uniref:Uncharacterized protein n=1 Tax=Papaver atlanticum TaxID=357466 RepID=A0AAD4XHU7_9MAGN|nr:hypothetical protein MKW98_000234 [Papaver atlanticum]
MSQGGYDGCLRKPRITKQMRVLPHCCSSLAVGADWTDAGVVALSYTLPGAVALSVCKNLHTRHHHEALWMIQASW